MEMRIKLVGPARITQKSPRVYDVKAVMPTYTPHFPSCHILTDLTTMSRFFPHVGSQVPLALQKSRIGVLLSSTHGLLPTPSLGRMGDD